MVGVAHDVVVAGGQRDVLGRQHLEVAVDHREKLEAERERRAAVVQLAEGLAGTGRAPGRILNFSGDIVSASSTKRVTIKPVLSSKCSTSGLTPALAASRAATASLARLMYSAVPLPGMRRQMVAQTVDHDW